MMDNLKDMIGKKATWRTIFGVYVKKWLIIKTDKEKVELFEGVTHGVIVEPHGYNGFG